MKLLEDVAFWESISAFAWPVTVLIVAFLFRGVVLQLFQRDSLKIKVAGMEITVAQAAEQAGKGLSDIQERVARLEQGSRESTDVAVEESPTENSTQKSILWVDDFPSNNAFIIEKLEADGIRVRKELSTDAAMEALRDDSFDAIISDLGRIEGGKDNPFAGLELARALKKTDNKLPILIFAGDRGLENRDRLLKAGADDVTNSAVDVFYFVQRLVER